MTTAQKFKIVGYVLMVVAINAHYIDNDLAVHIITTGCCMVLFLILIFAVDYYTSDEETNNEPANDSPRKEHQR